MIKEFEELTRKYEENGLKELLEKELETLTKKQLKEKIKMESKIQYVKFEKHFKMLDNLENCYKQTNEVYKKINEEIQKNTINKDLKDYIEKNMLEIQKEIKTIKENIQKWG